jgi:hypothetical protein
MINTETLVAGSGASTCWMRTFSRRETVIKKIKPFFYAVSDNEGNAVMDEICCCESPDELVEYFRDKIDNLEAKIVPVYTAPQIEMMQEHIKQLKSVVRECARTLQHNLSMHCIKDEQMMHRSLLIAWDAVGRRFCESQPKASNSSLDGRSAVHCSQPGADQPAQPEGGQGDAADHVNRTKE